MTRQDLSPDPLARALEADDAEERRQAVAALADMDAGEAMPLLVHALGDVDWRVRKEATVAARAFVADRLLVETLVPLLGTEEDVGFRNAAVEVLTATGPLATPLVTEALGTLDADGRKLAVDILGGSRDPSALAALALARHDPDPNVRHSAIEAIAMLGALSREPVEGILLRCLDDSETVVRLTALGGLTALGVAIPWERIESLLRDPTLRTTALAAAAFSDSPQAPPVVAAALNEARPAVFSQALRTLAQICESHPPRTSKRVALAVAPLPVVVHERIVRAARGELTEPIELRAAAMVVGAVVAAEGIREVALDALLDTQLEPAAHRALLYLGVSALPALVERLGRASSGPPSSAGASSGVESDGAVAMLEVIAAIAHSARPRHEEVAAIPGLFDTLRTMARGPSSGAATSALFALARLGTAADLEPAAELASEAIAPIAHAARGTLGAIARREPEAAVLLARRLAASDPLSLAVTAIIGALSARGEPTLADRPADLAYLGRALRDGDARTRKVAIGAVAELGGAESFDLLSLALADETREVQLAAAHALGRLSAGPSSGHRASVPPPRASAVIELVSRSNDEGLVAAAVDSLGDPRNRKPMSIPPGPQASPSSASDELVAALGALVTVSASAVAIAAVDALGRLEPSSPGRTTALAGALTHAEPDVARVALLKLEGSPDGVREVAASLAHSSADVRLLAAEVLARTGDSSVSSDLDVFLKQENSAAVRDAIAKAIALIAGRATGAQAT